ncbi:hypothetical protein ACFLS9_02945 [Bacteroidota bacterium]
MSKKYLAAFVCGFGAGVLQVVPFAKSFSCCLIIPAAAYIALILERKAFNISGKMEIKYGIILGLLTGLYAAVFGTFFDVLITFITKNNDIIATFPELQKMINEFPISENLKEEVIDMLSIVLEEIQESGFSLLYTLSILVNNLIIDSVFGLIGGLIGVQIINSRLSKTTPRT